MTGIVDSKGKPIKKALKPDLGEVSSIGLSVASYGGLLKPDDDTLKTRGGQDGFKLYRDLERDAHAWAVLDKRKRAVISRPWSVIPASDDARDVRMAELVEQQLKGFPFDLACHQLLDATLVGFAVSEVMWRITPGEVQIERMIPRKQDRFVFTEDNDLRLLTRDAPQKGIALPERKMVVHRHGGTDNSPYGLGLGTRLFWPVFFKRQNITFWLSFLDKYGAPSVIGKYPNGATKEQKDTLLNAASRMRSEAAAIIPEGMLIELVEAIKSGSTDAYEKLARYMDEQVALIVLGETMSTTASPSGLGSTQAEVHNDVRLELAQVDADLLSDTLNNTLVRWIVEFNDPGAGVPRVERDFSEPEDKVARASRDKILIDCGLEPDDDYIAENYPGWSRKQIAVAEGDTATAGADATETANIMNAFSMGIERFARLGLDVPESFIRDYFGIPKPGRGEKVLMPTTAEIPAPAAFSAPDEAFAGGQAQIDRAVDGMPADAMAALLEGALRPVLDRLIASGDEDSAITALQMAYPEMDVSALQEALARAIFIAEIWGRIESNA